MGHIPTRLCHPVIWHLVWIRRQAQLGKLEVRGLQASVYHFQLGFCTSVPASPCLAPPCPEVWRHLSLDTLGGDIQDHPEPTSTRLQLPLSPGPQDGPPSPCITLCIQPLCLCFSPSSIKWPSSSPHHCPMTSCLNSLSVPMFPPTEL